MKNYRRGHKGLFEECVFTSQYILSDRGGEITSKQFTWLAKELGFIKVYTSSHTTTSNSVIEYIHPYLKPSISTLICNHNTDWDELAHVAMMAYNVFPHSSAGKLYSI